MFAGRHHRSPRHPDTDTSFAHDDTHHLHTQTFKEIEQRNVLGQSGGGPKKELRRVPPKVKLAHKVVFVLGGPGSGKGTQCAKLVEDYGFTHLSAGDLLRDAVRSRSELGVMCSNLMREGKLVPMEVTIGLLKAAMEKAENKNFLIDGFPRALDQGAAFEERVQKADFVLFFDCPLETMAERLMERGKTSGRSDDNMDSIRKRFDTFTSQSVPVLDHYKVLGNASVVSSVPHPDAVFEEVKAIMKANGVSKKQ